MNKIKFNDFYKKYNEYARPLISELETERIEERKKHIKYIITYFTITVVILMFVLLLTKIRLGNDVLSIIVNVLSWSVAGFYILYNPIVYLTVTLPKAIKKYKLRVKNALLPNICSFIGDIEWSCKKEEQTCRGYLISHSDMIDSGIIPFYSISKAIDDQFSGSYKYINYTVEELVNDIGNRIVLIKLPMNKKIVNKVVIAPKYSITENNKFYVLALFCLYVIWRFCESYLHFYDITLFEKIKLIFYTVSFFYVLYCLSDFFFPEKTLHKDEKLKQIILEDTQFNKKYNVFCSDEVEARYLVTTAFMKRFYDLKTAFKANSIKCSFFGDSIMFAINTNHDVFEIGNLFRSLKDSSAIYTFYNELTSIYKIIDYFKLDEKTGL